MIYLTGAIEYDPEANAAYIRLPLPLNGNPVRITRTNQAGSDTIFFDWFEEKLIGIEILNASDVLNTHNNKEYGTTIRQQEQNEKVSKQEDKRLFKHEG